MEFVLKSKMFRPVSGTLYTDGLSQSYELNGVSFTGFMNYYAYSNSLILAGVENKCKIACADAGYANTDELKKIDDKQINNAFEGV